MYCPVGLRQGCVLSPVLFSMFINEIASAVEQHGIHRIQLMPGLLQIIVLFIFAEDIVLMSDTPTNFQNQLNVLNLACKDLFLNVKTDKPKILVFRK